MPGNAAPDHGAAAGRDKRLIAVTPEFLLELSRLPLFPRTAMDLCRVAGVEGAARLIAAWGGQVWPVPIRAGGVHRQGVQRYAQLSEIVGESAAQRIVAYWGGTPLSIPNLKEVIWSRTQDLIRADFDRLTTKSGYSATEAIFELGIKYSVTGKAISNVLKRPDNGKAEGVVQLGLF